jgi:polysaccharide chain length determinant protein (PEP-CTERM system associated)
MQNNPKRFLTGFWRRRWLAVATAWLSCLVGWSAVMSLPSLYTASAQLYVAADPVLTPLLKGIAINGDSDAEYRLLRQTLLSDPNLTALTAATGLNTTVQGPGAQAALIHHLAATIKVMPQTNELFTISFDDHNPKTAFDVVQGLVNIYLERSANRDQDDLNNASGFLDQQIAYFQQQLKKEEQTRAAFLSKYTQLLPGATGMSELEQQSNLVASLQGKLQDTIAKRDMLQTQLKQTQAALNTTAPDVAAPDSDLITAAQQVATLKRRYTSSYPGLIQAEQREAALQAAAGESAHLASTSGLPNDVYTHLKLDLLDTNSTLYSLNRQIAAATQERDRLARLAQSKPGLEAEYADIDRNYGILLNEYNDLMARREAIRIGTSANINANQVQLKIVNPPRLPREPTAPNKPLLLSGVLLAGIGAGAAIAVIFSEIEGCFYNLSDLRTIGLPVIGGISQLREANRRVAPMISFAGAIAMLILVYGGFLIGAVSLVRRFA